MGRLQSSNQKEVYKKAKPSIYEVSNMDASSNKTFTTEDEELLRDSLKRCSAETIEAAITYRQSGNPDVVPVVILGIIERFLEPDIRPRLKEGSDETRLADDLGIDSLTMVEVVMLVEEVLEITIENEELRGLRTIGDIKLFIDCKIKGVPLPAQPKRISVEEIDSSMPHGQPFLFIQEASVSTQEAQSSYLISGNEYFLEGHFKENPVFPASIMLEALGQLAVLYILKAENAEFTSTVDKSKIYFASCDGVRCHRICKPGDTLTLSVKPKRIRHPMATFEGQITVGNEKAVFAEEITLAYDYESNDTPATEENA